MIFILLNILIFIILISVWYNPNGNFTNLQFFTLLVAFFGTLFFLKDLSHHESSLSIFLNSLCLSSNSLLFSVVSKLKFTEKSNKSSLIIYNESDSITKKENEILLPFYENDFSKVSLNPKFVTKYYELQHKKRNFLEVLTFALLAEYFYFKSLKSFYLVKREQNKKDYLHIK